jgi:hypothetical protein
MENLLPEVCAIPLKAQKGVYSATDADLRAAAYHEAGHCVVAVLHRLSIRYVTIVPGKRKDANGYINAGVTMLRKSRAASPCKLTKGEMRILYAGAICQYLGTGEEPTPVSYSDDHRDAVAMVSAFLRPTDTPEERQRAFLGADAPILMTSLESLFKATTEFLLDPKVWKAVVCIAATLLTRRTLRGGEAKRLVLETFDAPD